MGSLRSARTPPAFRRQFLACQMAGDLRRRRGHRNRGRAPPARFATPSVHRCANVRQPEWFSVPPLHPGGRPFLRFSEWTLLGGRQGSRLTYPTGRASALTTLAQLSLVVLPSQAVPSAPCLLHPGGPSVPASKAYHPSSFRGSAVAAPLLSALLLCLIDSLEEASWQAA